MPYSLLPTEKILRDIYINNTSSALLKDSLFYLLRLTSSENEYEIGLNGPILGDIPLDMEDKNESLRLFETLFGRDSIYTSLMLLDYYPNLVKTTIKRLAELQGTKNNLMSEEEPGKILHEYRDPEDNVGQQLSISRGWEFPYYGATDTTLLYISLLNKYCKKYGYEFLNEKYNNKDNEETTIYKSFILALEWVNYKTSQNAEGFVEMLRLNPNGLENQMWKDSFDSFTHKDGSLANYKKGVASLLIQGLLYDAFLDGAEILSTQSYNNIDPNKLIERAKALKKNILDLFNVNNQYFCIGLDRDESNNWRQINIKTLDMGHLLNTYLFNTHEDQDQKYIRQIVNTLFSQNLLSPNGIRTLSKDEVRYRPGSYQCGSIWPWENYFISLGLEKHGEIEKAKDLQDKIVDIIKVTNQYPEFIRGDDGIPKVNTRIVDVWSEIDNRMNRIEQPPQQIQAWTVCSVRAIEIKSQR